MYIGLDIACFDQRYESGTNGFKSTALLPKSVPILMYCKAMLWLLFSFPETHPCGESSQWAGCNMFSSETYVKAHPLLALQATQVYW